MGWDERQQAGPVAGTALIGKALRLVDVIGAAPGAVGVRDLLSDTGWSRPTLYRILSALVAEGYVRRDPALRGYTLGYRFLDLAQNVWASSDLVSTASLDLQRLRNLTGETAYLAAPHRDGVLSLGKFESPHAVRSAARLGVLKPYHCTSQGKAILAFWDAAEVARRIGPGPYERFTEATVVDPDALALQLAEVRERGFAIEDQEILAGTRCVGAPILDRAGRPVGAISVAAPAWRLTMERAKSLGPEVAEVARHIGQTLRAMAPSRLGPPGISVLAGPSDPAFHGADPWWDEDCAVLRWTDRLGQAVHATTSDRDDVARLPQFAAIAASVHAHGRSVLLVQGQAGTGSEAWFLEGSSVRRIPVAGIGDVTAACAGPGSSLWLAVRDGERGAIGCLEDDRLVARWSVPAPVDALAWAPGGRTLMAASAGRGHISVLEEGRRAPRLLSRIPPASGKPAAMAFDGAGRLWVALHDGWAVVRIDDDGEIAETLPVPVPRPSGLAFGGPTGDRMFVTTSRYGLGREVIEAAPLSGLALVVGAG